MARPSGETAKFAPAIFRVVLRAFARCADTLRAGHGTGEICRDWRIDGRKRLRYGTLRKEGAMTGGKNVALPDDLLAAVAEIARTEGKTPDQVIEEATRRYLARERLDRFVGRNEQRSRELGITEADVPRIVKEFRREPQRDR